MNKKFIASLGSKNVCDVLEKKANEGSFTNANAAMLCMIINLLRYMDEETSNFMIYKLIKK